MEDYLQGPVMAQDVLREGGKVLGTHHEEGSGSPLKTGFFLGAPRSCCTCSETSDLVRVQELFVSANSGGNYGGRTKGGTGTGTLVRLLKIQDKDSGDLPSQPC